MLRRDPAFDGRFFIAVRTTMIYCRPVCRVRMPHVENVRFYPSAAAAERAGYRPCLRCRPETAPFCPAWAGTRTTVERALRLIEAGALDTAGVDRLAARLGIGARHLSRLFGAHLDASPLQVAKTLRVQRAKRLLDATGLPIPEIASRSGFRSARRMRAAFCGLYGRPPSAMRKGRGAGARGSRASGPADTPRRMPATRHARTASSARRAAEMPSRGPHAAPGAERHRPRGDGRHRTRRSRGAPGASHPSRRIRSRRAISASLGACSANDPVPTAPARR